MPPTALQLERSKLAKKVFLERKKLLQQSLRHVRNSTSEQHEDLQQLTDRHEESQERTEQQVKPQQWTTQHEEPQQRTEPDQKPSIGRQQMAPRRRSVRLLSYAEKEVTTKNLVSQRSARWMADDQSSQSTRHVRNSTSEQNEDLQQLTDQHEERQQPTEPDQKPSIGRQQMAPRRRSVRLSSYAEEGKLPFTKLASQRNPRRMSGNQSSMPIICPVFDTTVPNHSKLNTLPATSQSIKSHASSAPCGDDNQHVIIFNDEQCQDETSVDVPEHVNHWKSVVGPDGIERDQRDNQEGGYLRNEPQKPNPKRRNKRRKKKNMTETVSKK
ncbi:GATA zinc finger domain-containing protein 10-like [Ochlerotatus camptorhynchus]|uniref:GATA zinc finger domain-containing protein 10-like n=1 Tax=Ochlerotatus camptorhynchus TaxID=644619 RepID=UPI0031DDF7EA